MLRKEIGEQRTTISNGSVPRKADHKRSSSDGLLYVREGPHDLCAPGGPPRTWAAGLVTRTCAQGSTLLLRLAHGLRGQVVISYGKGVPLSTWMMCVARSILDDFPDRKLKAVLGQALLVSCWRYPAVLSTLTAQIWHWDKADFSTVGTLNCYFKDSVLKPWNCWAL